jgi:hypothetical protein
MHITIEKYTIPEGKTRYRTSDTTLLEFRRSILVKSEKTREVISGVTHITQVNYWTSESDWKKFIEMWETQAERDRAIAHMKANSITKVTTDDKGTVLRKHPG